MRALTNALKVRQLMAVIGQQASGPGRVYLTGGATAVLIGWRDTTVDVDCKLDPEPAGVFEAISRLKDALDINVELASPDQFVPAVPGWRERSVLIGTFGKVEFFHYDPIGQALAKLERGHSRDLADVRAMIARGLVTKDKLWDAFESIRPELIRYPSVDETAFAEKVRQFVSSSEQG